MNWPASGVLGVVVEAVFDPEFDDPGSWEWTDLTGDSLEQPLRIVRGRPGPRSAVAPSSLSMTLGNDDGKLTPGHPGSPWDVQVGTPVRVSVPVSSYLSLVGPAGTALGASTDGAGGMPGGLRLPGGSGNNATTPHHASLAIVGDITLRCRTRLVDLTNGNQFLGSKYAGPGTRCWAWRIEADAKPRLTWTSNGTANVDGSGPVATAALPYAADEWFWLEVALDVDNGSAQHVTTFRHASDDTDDHAAVVGWAPLGTAITTAGVTSIANTTQQVEIGTLTNGTQLPMDGTMRAFVVLDSTGATVLDVRFADPTQGWREGDTGGATGTDATGKVVTINGTASIVSGLQPIGDLWVAVDVRSSGRPALDLYAAQWQSAGDERSWLLSGDQGDRVTFQWSTDGTAAGIEAVAFDDVDMSRHRLLAAHLDADDGGDHVVSLYTASAWGDWSLFRRVDLAGTTSVHAGSAPVMAGDAVGLVGARSPSRVRRVEVRSGGEDGPLLVSPDFTVQAPGATSFVDGQGNTWDLVGGAEVTDREVRFVGQLGDIAPRWEGDLQLGEPLVDMTAAGVLRQLQVGSKGVVSALSRAIVASSPVAYWPCEDGSGASVAVSGIPSGSPAAVSGWSLAADESLPGSLALPVATGPARIAGPVGVGGTDAWTVGFVYRPSAAPEDLTVVAEIRCDSGIRRWTIELADGVARVRGYVGGVTPFVDQLIGIGPDVFEGVQWLQFSVVPDGAFVEWSVAWHNVGDFIGSFAGTALASVAGQVQDVTVRGVEGWTAGHIAAWDRGLSLAEFSGIVSVTGYAGQSAASRILTTASDLDVDIIVQGKTHEGIDATSSVGPQRSARPLDVVAAAVEVDMGILGEQLDGVGLTYRSRRSLYSQAPALVLDAAAGEIVAFTPVADDQRYRNVMTVSRRDGSSVRVQAESWSPRRDYGESMTLDLATDGQLPDQAAWRLHVDSWPEMRCRIRLDLRARPHLIDAYCGLVTGDLVRVVNLREEFPVDSVDLIVDGTEDVITSYTWDATVTGAPAGPWSVGRYLDPVLGRLDSDSSTLADAIDADDTALSVATVGGLWFDADGAFELRIGGIGDDHTVYGEIVTVTAVTGATSPQTFTVVRGARSYAWPAGTPVRLAHPLRLAL